MDKKNDYDAGHPPKTSGDANTAAQRRSSSMISKNQAHLAGKIKPGQIKSQKTMDRRSSSQIGEQKSAVNSNENLV